MVVYNTTGGYKNFVLTLFLYSNYIYSCVSHRSICMILVLQASVQLHAECALSVDESVKFVCAILGAIYSFEGCKRVDQL